MIMFTTGMEITFYSEQNDFKISLLIFNLKFIVHVASILDNLLSVSKYRSVHCELTYEANLYSCIYARQYKL